MSALRSDLMTVLAAGMPGWSVQSSAIPENITRPTIAVGVDRLDRLKEAPGGAYQVTYSIVLASPYEDVTAADEQLDAAILTLFECLWTDDPLVMIEEATAGQLGETYFVWTVRATRALLIGT